MLAGRDLRAVASSHGGNGTLRQRHALQRTSKNQLGLRINGHPRPHTAKTGSVAQIVRQVFVFGVHERPDFVALEALAIQVAKSLVLIFRAGLA